MRRRAFLATTTAVASTGLAGCSLLGGDDGGDGPQQPIHDAANALESEDADAYRSAYHPDSEERPADDLSFEQVNYTDVTIERIETLEQNDGNATVEVEMSSTTEITFNGETRSESQTTTSQFEVRQYEGEWRIWSSQSANDGGSQ